MEWINQLRKGLLGGTHTAQRIAVYSKAQEFFEAIATERIEQNDVAGIPAVDLWATCIAMQDLVRMLQLPANSDDALRNIFEELYWFRFFESLLFLAKRFPEEPKRRHITFQLPAARHHMVMRAHVALSPRPSPPHRSSRGPLELHSPHSLIPIHGNEQDLRDLSAVVSEWEDHFTFYDSRYVDNVFSPADRDLVLRCCRDNNPDEPSPLWWLTARVLSHAKKTDPLDQLRLPLLVSAYLFEWTIALRKKNPLELFDLTKCFIVEWPDEFYAKPEA